MAANTDQQKLGSEIKRYRGRGAGGSDFCLWIVPGILIPLGFFSIGLYFALHDYAQSGISDAGQPWFVGTGLLLLPFALLAFRAFRAAGQAVAVHKNGLHLIRLRGPSLKVRWTDIHAVHTSGTRYQLAGKPVSDRYRLVIATADGRTIEIPDHIQDLDELSATIRSRIDPIIRPDLISRLESGEPVGFGPVTLDRSGLRVGRRAWAWQNLDRLEIAGGSLVIESTNGRIALPVAEVPNTALLLELAARYGSGDRKL